MANHERSTQSSTPASTNAPGVTSHTAATVTGSPRGGGTAAGGTGPGGSGAGGVLAGLGVTNSGYTQVKVGNLVTTKFETKVEKRLSGVTKYLPAGTSLLLSGTTFTVAQIVSVLEAILALFTAKATAQAQAKAMVSGATAALKAELPTANQFVSALDTALVSLLGKGNPVLTNFGLSTGVKKTPTVATQAQAKGTAALTRKARNTLGKAKRQKVKGGTAKVAVTGPAGEVLPGSSADAAAAQAPASNGSGSGK